MGRKHSCGQLRRRRKRLCVKKDNAGAASRLWHSQLGNEISETHASTCRRQLQSAQGFVALVAAISAGAAVIMGAQISSTAAVGAAVVDKFLFLFQIHGRGGGGGREMGEERKWKKTKNEDRKRGREKERKREIKRQVKELECKCLNRVMCGSSGRVQERRDGVRVYIERQ